MSMPGAAPDRPRRGAGRLTWLVGGVAALLLVAAVTGGAFAAWRLVIGPRHLSAGDVVGAQPAATSDPDSDTDDLWLVIPDGRVGFSVSADLGRVDSSATEAERDLVAGGDARLVRIAWSAPGGGVAAEPFGVAGSGTMSTTVSAVVEGHRFPLGDLRSGAGAVYVALPAGEMRLGLTFDGLTQTVATDGRQSYPALAKPLYLDRADSSRSILGCRAAGSPAQDGLTADVLCRAQLATAPYVDGLGWSYGDGPWRVALLAVSADNVTAQDGSTYRVSGADTDATLDGRPQVGRGRSALVNTGDSQSLAVFAGAEDDSAPVTLEVTRTLTLTKTAGDGPPRATYNYVGTVTGRLDTGG